MTSALELREVSKVYGSGPSEVNALSAVDLSVDRGELVRSWARAAPARARS
jgi:putative ABC transport system ATP-binding protein